MLARPAPCRAATVLVTVVAMLAALVLAALLGASTPAAAAIPSTVLPGDVEGEEVALVPPALRTPSGTAELDVVLGADAPGDVRVDLEVRTATTDRDGVVAPGPEAVGATVTAGSRLRPGERLRVQVTVDPDGPPVVVVAQVRGATSPTATEPPGAPVELTALVLPGPPPAAPTVTASAADGRVTGTVSADGPLLVTVQLAGATAATTFPDRLVLPDQPVEVTGDAARWPVPSVVSVTDEEGRTAAADTGRGALAVIAGLLLVATAVLAVLARRRRQRRRAASATAAAPPLE